MNRLRIGIIGTSRYVEHVHLPCLARHPRVAIAALCGRRKDRADELAHEYGVPRVFTQVAEMFDKNCIDAVVIATPDDLHYQMTLDALDADLHVLCEKPLALTLQQARELRDRAATKQRKNMIFFRWRWVPQYQELRRLVAAGWVGTPRYCSYRYLATYGRQPGYAWRFDERRATGVLGDLGSHMIDFALWMGGKIRRVTADLATFLDRFDSAGKRRLKGNDSAVLLLRFTNGAQGIIHVSATAELGNESQEQSVVIHGDNGRLELVFPRSSGPVLRGGRAGSCLEPLDVPDDIPRTAEPYDVQLLRHWSGRSVAHDLFVRAVLDDEPLTPTFTDGVNVQEVIDAALKSHDRGAWVTLPEA